MKKLFITFFMLIALISVFTLTLCAYESFGTVEKIDEIELSSKMGEGVATANSANARVKLECTCAQGSHTFPSYYIMEDASSGNAYGAKIAYTVFTTLNEKGASCGNKSFDIKDILAYELPDGVIDINSTMYTSDNALKNITFLDFSTSTTLKNMNMVSGCNWYNTSLNLEEVRFPASLTNISGYSFYGCTGLTTVVIPENSQIKTIGEYAFRNCSNLEGVYLPNGIESICGSGAGAFQYCSKLWLKSYPSQTQKPSVYYFPESLKSLDKVVFQGCSNLSETVVFPEGITSYQGWELQGSGTKNYVFKGYLTKADYVGNLTYYFVNPQNTDPNEVSSACGWGSYTLTKIFCHAEGNTTHLIEKTVNEGATCTKNASAVSYCFCETEVSRSEVENTALGHDNNLNNGAVVVGITYTDYTSNGYKTVKCARCSENNNDTEAEALINCMGYSTKEDNSSSICIGYSVNESAINEYKAYNSSFTYGVVAYIPKDNENPLKVENGAVAVIDSAHTIFAQIGDNMENCEVFDFVIKGFTGNEDLALVMGAYVFDGENAYYLCINNETGKVEQTEDAKTVSFTKISELVNSK